MKTPEQIDENELFELLLRSDEDSFSKIYRLMWPFLFNAAYKQPGEREKFEDIFQNVFVDLWQRKDKVSIG